MLSTHKVVFILHLCLGFGRWVLGGVEPLGLSAWRLDPVQVLYPLVSWPLSSSRVMAYSMSSRGSCSMALRNSLSRMGGGALGAWGRQAPWSVSPVDPALGSSPLLPTLISSTEPSLPLGSGGRGVASTPGPCWGSVRGADLMLVLRLV